MKQTLEHLPPDQRDEVIAMMQRYKQTASTVPGASAQPGTSPSASAQPGSAPQTATQTGMPAANEAAFGNLLSSLMGSSTSPDAGAIIDDLRSSGFGAPKSQSGSAPTEADFEALLNSPLARAVLGGVAAYGMQNMMADDDDRDAPSGAKPA